MKIQLEFFEMPFKCKLYLGILKFSMSNGKQVIATLQIEYVLKWEQLGYDRLNKTYQNLCFLFICTQF